MNAPEAVTLTLWRTHEMVVPSDEAIGRAEWHEERVADESYAYPDAEYRALPVAAYAALVAERDALREALRDMIDAASHVPVDREWSPLLTMSLTCARAALGAEGAG